jgi:coenzyme F420 hydrogenase subunit beta
MRGPRSLDDAVARVVDADNCSGCGACCLLDAGLEMKLDANGFNRPVRTVYEDAATAPDAIRTFQGMCPGLGVTAPRPAGAQRHPTMGPYVSVWEAWAVDEEVRYHGSSGGALTALMGWLVATGQQTTFVGARAAEGAPERTVTVQIQTRAEALASAGSRYAPVSNAADPALRTSRAGFVGKPCEAAALRALARTTATVSAGAPLLLSFFCAGTPSQHATQTLLRDLGVEPETAIRELWYRGRGWPGTFTAVTDDRRVETSYDTSWGSYLGPTMQWRCKVCADGVGESSDITAADFWRTDERGYPNFDEAAGSSALIARTQRGHDIILRAAAAGVLRAREIRIGELAAVQPFQRTRRTTLLGRLVGTRIAGRRVPRYRGFGLVTLASRQKRASIRMARGAHRRVRRSGRGPA